MAEYKKCKLKFQVRHDPKLEADVVSISCSHNLAVEALVETKHPKFIGYLDIMKQAMIEAHIDVNHYAEARFIERIYLK